MFYIFINISIYKIFIQIKYVNANTNLTINNNKCKWIFYFVPNLHLKHPFKNPFIFSDVLPGLRW